MRSEGEEGSLTEEEAEGCGRLGEERHEGPVMGVSD